MKLRNSSKIAKVLKGLSFLAPRRSLSKDSYEENELVPADVTEGHFAVVAVKGEESKRFIVELDYLSDPAFLRLLEQAREEYGFQQKGALALPCTPQELHNIIENRRLGAHVLHLTH